MGFSYLFKEGHIAKLQVANRLVMAPMCTSLSFPGGLISERLIDYYGARARSGIGLIITEYLCVDSPVGLAKISQLILDNDDVIGSHNLLTERVHRFNDCKIIAQLHHAGRETTRLITKGRQPVSPFNVPTEKFPDKTHELTTPEIKAISIKFGEAAYRAKIAGYDGVEIHAAHGYLINQFLSPYFNRRKDSYGKEREGRMKFLKEIIEEVKERVGSDYPIIVRLSVEEYLPGGLDLKESCTIAQEMEKWGVSAIDVSRGTFEAVEYTLEGMDQPMGCRVGLAEKIKRCVSVPVIIVGNIKDPEMCDRTIEEGKADFVALGRALLADAEWLKKAETGRDSEIRRCFSCNFCVTERSAHALPIQCAINPITGNEREFSDFSPLPQNSRALVVGGGPSGMEAARVLAYRGARVQLWEKEERVGGQVNIAARLSDKAWLRWLIEDQERELRRLGVEIFLDKEATTDSISKEDPEIIIIATGAEPKMKEARNLEGKGIPIVTAWNVLHGQWVSDYKKSQAIVWGGGRTGCEVAEVLVLQEQRVTLVTSRALDQLAGDSENWLRRKLVKRIVSHPLITLLVEYELGDLINGKVVVASKKSPEKKHLEASVLVMARGVEPVNDLAEHPGKGITFVVGDAKQPRDIKNAIHDGFISAFNIDLPS